MGSLRSPSGSLYENAGTTILCSTDCYTILFTSWITFDLLDTIQSESNVTEKKTPCLLSSPIKSLLIRRGIRQRAS